MSEYPSFDGRFPAVSGLSFKFDPSLPKDSRVTEVIVGDRGPLEDTETYTLTVTNFINNGGDGYKMFKEEGVK